MISNWPTMDSEHGELVVHATEQALVEYLRSTYPTTAAKRADRRSSQQARIVSSN